MMRGLEERFHILYLDDRSIGLGEVISSKTGRRVMETLYRDAGRVGVSASELSERVGAPRTTVLHHLYKLLDTGIVEVNPLLHEDIDWNKFWSEAKRLGLSKMEAERIRKARITGEKLFLPKKEGIILIPEKIEAKPIKKPLGEAIATIGSILGLAGALILLREFTRPALKVRIVEEAATAFKATPQASTLTVLGLILIAIAAVTNIIWLILTHKRRRP